MRVKKKVNRLPKSKLSRYERKDLRKGLSRLVT